ncbi:hypothetical protein [Micromonospora sp. LOL_015]|uniref:hypothetical protein n=1 Tax=Micromonospora sp. LOL_015 TaxID=3345416 RepID=UPI003A86B1DE
MSAAASLDGGLTVVCCDGHRCRALRRHSRSPTSDGESPDLMDVLREAVRCSQRAVLIRAECIGFCHRAPALLLISKTESAGRQGMLIGPVEKTQHLETIVELIQQADGS